MFTAGAASTGPLASTGLLALTAVVVAFVTYDPQRPSAPPVAVLDGTQITGVSHFFER